MDPVGHSGKANQFSAPAAITRKAESETIRCFQIAFGIETDRGNGTTTRGAPEEEYVREFGGSHDTSTIKEYEGDGHSISRIGRTFLLKMGEGFEWPEFKAYLSNPGISLSGHID